MMKLKKSSEQSRKKRSANPTIVIVCEGKDTEVKYFDNFNSRYTRVDVKISDKNSVGKNKGKKTDCENLIKKAIECKQNKYVIK